jgi:adenylate cyclase
MAAAAVRVGRCWLGLGIGLVAAVIALLLWWPGWLDGWEQKTYDWRVRAMARPGAASDRIVMVYVDQNSLDWGQRENGLSWPWPREVYAPIVKFCERQGARALVFDVLTTEPSLYGQDDDQALAQAFSAYGKVAAALQLGNRSGDALQWPDAVPKPRLQVHGLEAWLAQGRDLTLPRASFPVAAVAGRVAQFGNSHLGPDPDGVFRRVRLLARFAGHTVPTLGLAALLVAEPQTTLTMGEGSLRTQQGAIPIDHEGAAILNFRGPGGGHRAYSAAAVIQSELSLAEGGQPTISDPNAFRDRFVFFGFSAPGLFDQWPTPVGGVFPGVEVHATLLDNLLSHDFIRPLSRPLTIGLTLGLCLLAGLVTALFSGPVATLAAMLFFLTLPGVAAVMGYRQQLWLPVVLPEVALVLTLTGMVLANYATLGRQKRFIKNAFQQYLSPAVIEELIRHPERLRLGGERRQLSIFFSDLEGFTSISETLEPEALTTLLNDYLSAMTEIIHQEGGTIDKYEGDAIIAFWNAPLPQEDHGARAVRAALRCQAKLAEMGPWCRQRIGKELKMRIGVNTGPAVVGNMGSHTRFDYTMLGDAVNLASRLEGINKQFGTEILISAATAATLGGAFPLWEVARVAVVGRREAVVVFEPLLPEVMESRAARLDQFAKGREAFYAGRFAEASALFAALADQLPAARFYGERCARLMAEPAMVGPGEWQGVWQATSK